MASLIAVEIYASGFDGWGAWATAPLFLVPFVLSLAIAGEGAVQCLLELRVRSSRLSSAVFAVVAALPCPLAPRPPLPRLDATPNTLVAPP